MNEAVFKFRATGDVDINSLSIDYGNETPSEEWCHYPYVIKVEDQQDNLYELRFPLSPFNVPENGKLKRICTVTGPIYILPKLSVPIINVNLTIEQIACIDKLNCEELLNNIEVYVNSNSNEISADGGVVEIARDNFEQYFTEELVSITDGSGNICSWASFDEDGNIVVSRRYFDDSNEGNRTAIATYRYTYSSDIEIDNKECSGEFIGEIIQLPRDCDNADVRVVIKRTEFPSTGGIWKITDILELDGLDAGAYEITSINDIDVSDAVTGVQYSELCGYTVTLESNRAESSYTSLCAKNGYIRVTYRNKFIDCEVVSELVDVIVNAISCDEIIEDVYFAIQANDSEDYIVGGNIQVPQEGATFDVYIMGSRYSSCFSIDRESCVIPTSVTFDSGIITIPENDDPFLAKKFNLKLVANTSNSENCDCNSDYNCSFEQEFTFIQSPNQRIEEIGEKSINDEEECGETTGISEIDINNVNVKDIDGLTVITAEYNHDNVYTQGSQSMLAQANQATQGVLSVLQ